jgi:hypothetical protein
MDVSLPTNSTPAGDPNAVPGSQGGANQQGAAKRKGFGWLSGLISGIISGIISGALVSFALTPTGHAFGVYVFQRDPTPSCTNPQWLMQVPDDQIFANSYYFSPDTLQYYGILHSPDYSVDGDLRTSWLQWWPTTNMNQGNVSYNYVSWTFPTEYHIRLICIINGWTEDSNTYESTLPIGKATIYSSYASNSKSSTNYQLCGNTTVSLRDYIDAYTYQWQGVSFDCSANSISLRIDSVASSSIIDRAGHLDMVPEPKPDSNIKMPLVGLTEVRFYYAPSFLSHLPH